MRLGATEPARFTMANDFLTELEAAEIQSQPPAVLPPLPGREQPGPAQPSRLPGPVPEPPEDSQPKTSPVLLRILLAVVGMFLVCAIGAVIGANFFPSQA